MPACSCNTTRAMLDEAAVGKDIADWRGRSVKTSSGARQEEEAGCKGPGCCKGQHRGPAGTKSGSCARLQPVLGKGGQTRRPPGSSALQPQGSALPTEDTSSW